MIKTADKAILNIVLGCTEMNKQIVLLFIQDFIGPITEYLHEPNYRFSLIEVS